MCGYFAAQRALRTCCATDAHLPLSSRWDSSPALLRRVGRDTDSSGLAAAVVRRLPARGRAAHDLWSSRAIADEAGIGTARSQQVAPGRNQQKVPPMAAAGNYEPARKQSRETTLWPAHAVNELFKRMSTQRLSSRIFSRAVACKVRSSSARYVSACTRVVFWAVGRLR
jgi:hypothetical protein